MSIAKSFTNKRFVLIGLLLVFFMSLSPFIDVFAQTSSAPQINVGGGTVSKESPLDNILFKVVSKEENKAYGQNCGYSTVTGIFGGILKSFEKALSVRWEDGAEAIYCGDSEDVQEFLNNSNTGATGILNKLTATILEQRPASGTQFIEEKIYAITNPGQVYAQDPTSYFPGTGADLLSPIRGFWGWSVNVVFGLLIVIILVIAFAIIFRQKLPGNVEITIQNSIPNIALAMILVPLSYAISGIFIDLITIGSNTAHSFLLGPASPGHPVYQEAISGEDENNRGLYIDDYRVDWFNARHQTSYADEIASLSASTGWVDSNLSIISSILNIFDEEASGATSSGVTPGSTSAWLGTIINAILSIFMIYIGVKIFIKLFKKYLALILMPILSPFIFATVAIPGNGTKAIVSYAKSMGANSLGFIAAYTMILLTIILSSAAFQASVPSIGGAGLWVPPMLGLNPSGILGDIAGSNALVPFMLGLVSIGVYFSIPNVLDQIDVALDAQFTLPEFIRTPIDSFRESIGTTTRVGQVGLRSVAAANRFRATYGNRDTISAAWDRFQDRRRGYSPDMKIGKQYERAQRYGRQKAEYERERDAALTELRDTTVTGAAREVAQQRFDEAQSKLSELNQSIARTNIQPSFSGENDKKPKLIAEVKAKSGLGGINRLGISPVEIDILASNGSFTLAGELTLRIEGNTFTSNPTFNIYKAIQTSSTTFKPDDTDDTVVSTLTKVDTVLNPFLGPIDPVYKPAPTDISMFLEYKVIDFTPASNSDTIKLPLKVVFSGFNSISARRLFGRQDKKDSMFKGGIIQNNKGGIFIANHAFSNNKFIITTSINGITYESDPISPFIVISNNT